jgi:hypothetical protein
MAEPIACIYHRCYPRLGAYMSQLEIATVRVLNEFINRSLYLDAFLIFLVSSNILKGLLFGSLTSWAWFRQKSSSSKDREVLLVTVLACTISLLIGQALQDSAALPGTPCIRLVYWT